MTALRPGATLEGMRPAARLLSALAILLAPLPARAAPPAAPRPAAPAKAPRPAKPSPAGVKLGAVKVSGTLDPKRAAAAIRKKLSAIDGCRARRAAAAPPTGSASFAIAVSAAGAVEGVEVAGSTIADLAVVGCAREVLAGIAFPVPGRGRGAVVSCPLTFVAAAPRAAAPPKPAADELAEGDAVEYGAKRPPERTAVEAVKTDGPFASALLRDLLNARHRASLITCYERGLARDPALSGSLDLRLVVEPPGTVSAVEKTASTLREAGGVENCIVVRLSSARFPPADGGAPWTLAFRLVLTPPPPPPPPAPAP